MPPVVEITEFSEVSVEKLIGSTVVELAEFPEVSVE